MIETKPWADTLEELSPDRSQAGQMWRNRWRCETSIDTQRNGHVPAGEFWGSDFYPTKEEAEAEARADIASQPFYVIERGVEYLGAFPVEETP